MSSLSGGGNWVSTPLSVGPFPFPPINIIALDPGGTTGWARAITQGHNLKFIFGQLVDKHYLALWDLLYGCHPDTIVCESFEFRQAGADSKRKVELISREYIGVMNLYLQMHPNATNLMQSASTGKALIPDKGPTQNVKLEQLGLYIPGKQHAMDAARHLLRYMVVSDKVFKNFFAQKWMAKNGN